MDPWATGPAFVGGWWLATQPIKSWEEKLNECDFIYISHNHHDHHLELETFVQEKSQPLAFYLKEKLNKRKR